MKFNYRAKSFKTIKFLAALLAAVLILEVAINFVRTYRYVGWQKKDQFSWVKLAEEKQGELSACQFELESVKQDKDTAIRAANADLFQPLSNN